MILNESAVEMQTAPHDEINILIAFETAYVKYPSVESAKKVLKSWNSGLKPFERKNLNRRIQHHSWLLWRLGCRYAQEKGIIMTRSFNILGSFRPGFFGQASVIGHQWLLREMKNSLMNQPPATSYDWICDKCQYENFAKVACSHKGYNRDKNVTSASILDQATVKYSQYWSHPQYLQLPYKGTHKIMILPTIINIVKGVRNKAMHHITPL